MYVFRYFMAICPQRKAKNFRCGTRNGDAGPAGRPLCRGCRILPGRPKGLTLLPRRPAARIFSAPTDNFPMAPHIIYIDAAYAGTVAFNLTVNFERVLERRIAEADLGLWLDCVALDGGQTPDSEAEVWACFFRDAAEPTLHCFRPSHLADEIDGRGFDSRVARFTLLDMAAEAKVSTPADLMRATIEAHAAEKQVVRQTVVGELAEWQPMLNEMARRDGAKALTLLAMEEPAGRTAFVCENLGFSLLKALGVRAEELR